MRMKKRNPELDVLKWNTEHKVGTEVLVTRDNGTEDRTFTRSEAWVLGSHSAVVQLSGEAGCFLLSRVRPAPR
jgi:hypothetical protein